MKKGLFKDKNQGTKEVDFEDANGVIMGRPGYGMSYVKQERVSKNRLCNNNLVIGKAGKGTKIVTFKEMEFKQELAPKNACIEHVELKGEKVVIMTY